MAREELRELLKCSVCLETYTNPRILQCSHICCESCLRSQGQPGNRSYSCPLCRQDTPEPPGGAAGLLSVQILTNNLKGVLEKIPPVKNTSYCSEHGGKELELYCRNCDELMCYKCAYKGSKHHEHSYVDVRSKLEVLGVALSEALLEDQIPGEISSESERYCYNVIHDYNVALKKAQDQIASALELEGCDRVLKMREVAAEMASLPQKLKQQLARPNLFLSTAAGIGVKEATVRETSFVILHVVNFHGEVCNREGVHVECMLKSSSGGTRTTFTGEEVDGLYQYRLFTYRPTNIGKHQLHVKINGTHIKDSPFTVMVKPHDIGDIKLKDGRGIAIGIDGGVVVCEESGHRVSLLGTGKQDVRSFGSFGSKKGQFKYPRGLAVDRTGNILVADSGNHRIQKFTAEGKFLKSVCTKGSRHLQFNCPLDIAINPHNRKVYVVDKNCQVQILNSDLTYAGSFGKYDLAEEKLIAPSGVACDSTGNVFVADIGATKCNCRVKVFTAEGKFFRRFGIDTEVEPKSDIFIAIDAGDLVYMGVDCGVYRFTAVGEFIGCFPIINSRGLAGGDVTYVCHSDHIQPLYLEPPMMPQASSDIAVSSSVTSTAGPSRIHLLVLGVTVLIISIIIGVIISQYLTI